MQEIRTYEEAVKYLFEIPRFTGKNTMEDTKAFLKRLGNPECNMKIIHVAGTNGKGSVCSYLRHILEAAGKKVALFTSPHLVDVRERFVVAGEMVTKEAFMEAFFQIYNMLDWKHMEEAADGDLPKGAYHPSFFEYIFFMAMILFEKEKPDVCILETGLGGRLDATNSVSKKDLAVITRISLEHVEYLGDTLEQIAGEKAGIIHSSAPVVYFHEKESVSEVFCQKAKECGVKATSVSKEDYEFLKIQNKNIDFCLHTEYYGYISLILHTMAFYQMENCALAVRAIEILDGGKTISKEHVIAGVEKSFWPGRMEEVFPEVFVDGAHNADGIRAFLDSVEKDGFLGKRKLVFGVVKDKDYFAMIEALVERGLFSSIALTPVQNSRGLDGTQLKNAVEESLSKYEIQEPITLYNSVDEALEQILDTRQQSERVYVAGSLYLVGEVKSFCNRKQTNA